MANLSLKWEKRLYAAFLVFFFLTAFLHNSSLTFGKSVISFFQWPAVALGAGVLFLRLCRFRDFFFTRQCLFLALFSASFLLSALIFFRFGFYGNLRTFVFLLFTFFVLFPRDRRETAGERKWKMNLAAGLFLAGTVLLSLVSLVMFFAGYQKIEYRADHHHLLQGFVWGRLFGAWWDPNIGAVASALAAVLSLQFLFIRKRWFWRLLFFPCLIVSAAYVVLSDSRTGAVALAAGIGVYGGLICEKLLDRYDFRRTMRIVLSLLFAVLLAFLTFFAVKFGKPAPRTSSSFLPKGETFGRTKEDIHGDVTNRRLDIWLSGLEIWKKSPVFGTSRAGILPFAEEKVPDTYILTNDYQKFDSMHNAYLDILVSQGAVGFLIFLLFGASSLLAAWKNREKLRRHVISSPAIVASVLVAALFITEIVYLVTPTCLLAWIALSSLVSPGEEENE